MSVFIISCGGTGGHLSPGIALAESLTERGHRCILVISNKQVDARLLKKYSYLETVKISAIGFSLLKPIVLVKFIYNQFKSIFSSLKLIKDIKPNIVVGFGGFTTMSISIAAFLMGCPLILHEANRKPGKAIRLLSVLAHRVYLPPGVQLRSLPPKTLRHLGYPVRKEVRPMFKETACKRLSIPYNCKRLLIFGGSQGANILNKWVYNNFERLGVLGIHVYCITGQGKLGTGKLEYLSPTGESIQAVFTPFADNMAEVLSCADLVISRAGAGSIAEFCRCGLPCILVPYPYATDNHQLENAKFLEKQGGGIVVEQKNLHTLFDEVASLIFNDWLLEKFKQNLRDHEVRNSLELMTDDLESFNSQYASLPYVKI